MSKPTRNEYTYAEFIKEYPNDDVCLEKIFQMTYGRMQRCPKCKSELGYVRVKNRKAYQCRKCYNQVYPLLGTAFARTKIPLTMWFYGIFMFTVSKNGLSAHELSRAIGVSPKTALRMLKKTREFIYNDQSKMSGEVQIDETFVGGKNKNRHYDKKVKQSQGRSYKDKVPVIGMIESGSGRAIAVVAHNVTRRVLHPILLDHIERGTVLLTDEYRGYQGLERFFRRKMCNHSKKQFTNDGASTNAVENLWSCLKRTIHGSYIKVSKKYLHLYVKEAVFRFNHRYNPNIFKELLSCLVF
ncbi:MAG: IS1595 family transposase [Taibaiella sp.]|jgi:transposase-like protein